VVTVAPKSGSVLLGNTAAFTAKVTNTTDTVVAWSANGTAGGSSTLGTITPDGMYTAPADLPSPASVQITATSHADATKSDTAASAADATKSASSQITVTNHVVVSVMPGSVTLAPLAVQGFTASVLGTTNQTVVWQVQGTACSSAGVCGSITANGTYTAPGAAPTPDAIQAVAVRSDDSTQSGAANITISAGANILTLHPSSVYAGAAQGFTLRVEGSGFAASSPGPGSVVLIAGTARTTTCSSVLVCTAPVTAADVAATGSVSVQIQNPGGTKSNAVTLVVAAPNVSDEVIALTSETPSATGKDIVVVEPTTAGVSVPGDDLDMNVAALGAFSTTSNACVLSGNPIPLLRPVTGTATADICLFSQSHGVYGGAEWGGGPSSINNAIVPLCRNATTDAGWPPLQGCVVPGVDISFTTRTRPGP
jgi:hypothetical protein